MFAGDQDVTACDISVFQHLLTALLNSDLLFCVARHRSSRKEESIEFLTFPKTDQAQKFKKRGVHRIFDVPKNNDCKLVSVLDVFLGIYRNFWNNLLVKHVQTVSPHSHR